jgi:sensor histidine kinase YesM
MNSIQQYINANDKESANKYLTDFATLIRMNLTISHQRFIPLDEEISYLNLYLKFEKLRFGDRLNYEITIDPAIDITETTIAVMMIQPFVENAVWHGILPIDSNGYIRVHIEKETDNLIKISVEDNGAGIDQEWISRGFSSQIKESHGLSMTLQRLKLMEKSSGSRLFIRFRHLYPEKENKGTLAELILPTEY